ncbi:MAG: hypothetical protein JSS42_10245 [Proteobacteria bacterium]|uniref:hypothetical protein n=1 Tax=Rudaea sp. TaxID=2136325 RepID=UPI0032206611|nr:hypothetical protein [Pseudomonadota bacterium]
MRVAVWLAILALALLGRWWHSDAVTATIVPLALGFFFLVTPILRGAIVAIAIVEAAAWALGGTGLMIDLLPALIAAFVGWLFARSLAPPRVPLIARAIVAIEGETQLRDAAVARYARALTWFWAVFQALMAAFGLLCVLRDRAVLAAPLPSARAYDLILPLAVASLFFGEFLLRPRLLPQAPRHTLAGFLRALGRAWPDLIEK